MYSSPSPISWDPKNALRTSKPSAFCACKLVTCSFRTLWQAYQFASRSFHEHFNEPAQHRIERDSRISSLSERKVFRSVDKVVKMSIILAHITEARLHHLGLFYPTSSLVKSDGSCPTDYRSNIDLRCQYFIETSAKGEQDLSAIMSDKSIKTLANISNNRNINPRAP